MDKRKERIVVCSCGKEVKISGYFCPEGTSYKCSLCRGIKIEKKGKIKK